MSTQRLNTDPARGGRDNASLLSPMGYDDDASSIHSRSDQDTDSDDDELLSRARNSRELRAHDRIMLMEEEEMDRLVTDSRRRQERERRGSGLAMANPLKIFGRRPSSSQLPAVSDSTDDLLEEKRTTTRTARRNRRQKKRDRLLEDAHHGEDGELMYEMEEGGMKEGSSTGESSERDDSDEMDRRQLNLIASAKAERRRGWRRWILIHTIIVIGFAILVLIAWKLSKGRKTNHIKPANILSNGTALFGPTTLIISLDGFRADFLQRGLTPRLNALVAEGVSPKWMHPSFPSVTFPNHYTLATGLYPESHGIVGNTFWDPTLKADFHYTDPARSLDTKWWGGEAFWVTAERQGLRSAIHMWPGSEVPVKEFQASIIDKFNGKEPLENKVKRIMEFLDMPGLEDPSVDANHMRPQLIASYVPNVDSAGHRYGPNSTEIQLTISEVDAMMDHIFIGLEQRNLTDIVNVIVVSDHGMATTDVARMMQLEDLIDIDKIEHIDGWPLYGLRPKNPDDLQELYDGLVEVAKTNPNIEVYLRDVNMPERYHFSKNERIAPLWIVPKTGWAIVTHEEFNVKQALEENLVYHPRGLHGYDHEHPLMRAIFIARGPAFPHPPNSEVEPFQNIEVYNMLCDSLGIEPRPNNGTLRLPLNPIGLHKPEDAPEIPQDPVSTTEHVSSAQPESTQASAQAESSAEAESSAQSLSSAQPKPSAQPGRPNLPEKPTQPGRPTLPEEPPKPARPTMLPKPPIPAQPAQPSTPEQPKKPAMPEQSTKPATPTSAEPAATSPSGPDNDHSGDDKGGKGWWKWIQDEVGKAWDKLTGDKKEDKDTD